jgi:ligand-binding sensor domain-containing protein
MFARHAFFKRRSLRFLAGWAFRLSCIAACAVHPHRVMSEPVSIWTVFTPDNSDVPHTDILALTTSAEDTLWIGTHGGGLARFDKDGRWKIYTKASTNGGLPYDLIQALALDRDGSLWIGTERGLARLDEDGSWKTFKSIDTKDSLPNDNVLALTLEADGVLWIGTQGGGLARRDRDGSWQTYNTANTNDTLPSNDVSSLALDKDGALWIGTSGGGLARLDKSGQWHTYSKASTKGGLPSDDVKALALDADGVLWIGTSRDGLARRDRSGEWHSYSTVSTSGGLPNDEVWTLTPAADGALWVGTYGGVAWRDNAGRWQTYNRANSKDALRSDKIWALAPSKDGALWIGTFRGGLARLDIDRRWQRYSRANTKGDLPNDNVQALSAGPGRLWIGTKGGGLASLETVGRWQIFNKANTQDGLPSDNVQVLTSGAKGALWVGTDGGLARLDSVGRWQTFSKANTHGGLPDDNVQALVVGADNTLWIGTTGGLARLDSAGHWQTFSKANTNGGLPNDNVRALAVGGNGALWIGTTGGLAWLGGDGIWQTYTEGDTNGGLPNNDIRALAVGAEGAIWIGTYHFGLVRRGDGRWHTYTTANTHGGLPFEIVQALSPGSGGTLWAGTQEGLARLDGIGHWQTYSTANTTGALPDNNVQALAPDANGGLWIGTAGGLGYFRPAATPSHRIVEVIGESVQVTQSTQTVSVVAFDSSYRTEPWSFRYAWRMIEPVDEPDPKITRSAVYKALFDRDGVYRLRANAVDRNGDWSDPRDIVFRVVLPRTNPTLDIVRKAGMALVSSGLIYFALIFPLIPLYPRFSWARTAINCGLFTKFPLLHKTILNTRWARGYLFRQLLATAKSAVLPKPYIPQTVFAAAEKELRPLTFDGSGESVKQLFEAQRRALLIARSGTGKSVFLRHLQRNVAEHYECGESVSAPVLIDLRIHALSGDRKVQDLIRDSLRGAGVELADPDIDFLVGKGGFLILVDSLNELPDTGDARVFHTFLNQDARNFVLVASQVDLIRRPDLPIFNLAEVTPQQASSYLAEAAGRDIYAELPQEAQSLARNPQDLALLAEVAVALGTARVPIHRAELYAEILNQDGALSPWVESSDPLLLSVYKLAFRMVAERRVLQDDQLREWIAADPAVSGDAVAKIMQAIQASRLFRREVERDVLGQEKPVNGFRHELIGKFLAARHVRRMIGQGSNGTLDYVTLSGDELWLDMFYFVIDEIDSSPALNHFLRELLPMGGPARKRITSYAIGTRRVELDKDILATYEKAKLDEDLALTPAA